MKKLLKIIWCLVGLAPFSAALGQAANVEYDGSWWLSISTEEQEAFFSGDFDCYVYDVKGEDYSDQSVRKEAQVVTEDYRDHPSEIKAPVQKVFRQISVHKKTANGERHAYYDGEFWRQSSHKERLAFVQSYLACRKTYLGDVFYADPEEYVKRLSSWYGISAWDLSEDVDEKTVNDKIGDVLVKRIKKGKL